MTDETGDRGDRPDEVLRRRDGARRRRPAGRRAAASSRCSGRTARARRPSCGSWPPCSRPDAGRARVAGFDVVRERRAGAPPHQPDRPVRGGRRAADRRGEPAHDGRGWPACAARDAARAGPASCWSGSTSPTPAGGGSRPTPAACGAGSTSPRAWSARPAVIFLDEPTTGLDPRSRQAMWEVIARARRRRRDGLPHHPVPRGGRPAGRPHRRDRRRPGGRRGHAGRAQAAGRRPAPRPDARRRGRLRATAAAVLGGRAIAPRPGRLTLGVATDGSAAHVARAARRARPRPRRGRRASPSTAPPSTTSSSP